MDYKVLRERMVKGQLMPRGIKDSKILDVFLKVERQKFVPQDLQDSAYADSPLPIGENQTISQPYIVALMTELLNLTKGDKVLEIGTGSGYQTAILAELAQEVYSVERWQKLADRAEALLAALDYQNIHIKVGDGTLGWPEFAPFDKIMITAASAVIPEPLIEQLRENGRMILPLGGAFSQMLTLLKKNKEVLQSQDICSCVFVPLVGKYA